MRTRVGGGLVALALLTWVAASVGVSARPAGAVQTATPPTPDSGAAAAPTSTQAGSPPRTLVNQYCITCHSDRLKTAGLTLQSLDPAEASSHADVWEKVIRKLRGRMMPPAGMPRPDDTALETFVS